MTVPTNTESRDLSPAGWEPTSRENEEIAINGRAEPGAESVSAPLPAAAGEEDLLDWEVWLEAPPRPERTFLARFEYRGRDRPIPIDDLEVEQG